MAVQEFADGDICVVMCQEKLAERNSIRLARQVAQLFRDAGRRVRVVVLDGGIEVQMLRRRKGGM